MPVNHAYTKRQKERLRAEKQREKEARRQQRKSDRPDRSGGSDPDLAGIVPGPQPPHED